MGSVVAILGADEARPAFRGADKINNASSFLVNTSLDAGPTSKVLRFEAGINKGVTTFVSIEYTEIKIENGTWMGIIDDTRVEVWSVDVKDEGIHF
ncbi:hypothetical protein EVAR_81884_1 [Eumeta japonica]|uniref:Uncharacterized protein n=1 Tax=Eumeta variegata TaxID=151549 RepID=A0A4C1UY92_EUMVA|nr:hypothetical protein EVAR_81884_1 [Eumeta japonica]